MLVRRVHGCRPAMLRFLVVLVALLALPAAPARRAAPAAARQAARRPAPTRRNDGRRLPRHPAARHARALQRGRARRLPRDRPTVPHCCDQLGMYRDLVYATPGLKAAQIPNYFKDSSFGVAPGAGRAHVLAALRRHDRARQGASACRTSTARRATARCSASATPAPRTGCSSWTCCATPGAGELSSFAGGSNAAMDAEQWEVAPYTEADLTRQAAAAAGRARRTRATILRATSTTTSPASTSTSPRPGSTRRRCRASTPRSAIRKGRTRSSART